MARLGIGIIIGVGLAGLTRISRPTVKRAMKLGFSAIAAIRGALGEGMERLADLAAEVREEMAREQQAAGAAPAAARVKREPPAS